MRTVSVTAILLALGIGAICGQRFTNKADMSAVLSEWRKPILSKLKALVDAQTRGSTADVYELLSPTERKKRSLKQFSTWWSDANPRLVQFVSHSIVSETGLPEAKSPVGWVVFGCGTFRRDGKLVRREAVTSIEKDGDQWYLKMPVNLALQVGAEDANECVP